MTAMRSAGARSCAAGIRRVKVRRGAAATLVAIANRRTAKRRERMVSGDSSILLYGSTRECVVSKPPGRAFLRRQGLQARRPPAGLDGFDELLGQALGAHLPRQRVVVVVDRDEVDRDGAPHPALRAT